MPSAASGTCCLRRARKSPRPPAPVAGLATKDDARDGAGAEHSSWPALGTSSLISAAVLEWGWQKMRWESGWERDDDEREEAEDAERMRPSCVGDGEESDSGQEAN